MFGWYKKSFLSMLNRSFWFVYYCLLWKLLRRKSVYFGVWTVLESALWAIFQKAKSEFEDMSLDLNLCIPSALIQIMFRLAIQFLDIDGFDIGLNGQTFAGMKKS